MAAAALRAERLKDLKIPVLGLQVPANSVYNLQFTALF
jgi:hypothetical protein